VEYEKEAGGAVNQDHHPRNQYGTQGDYGPRNCRVTNALESLVLDYFAGRRLPLQMNRQDKKTHRLVN